MIVSACPICEADTAPRPHNPCFPFCSERCRMVDLGHWLDGTYRIPGDPAEGEGATLADIDSESDS